MSRRIEPFDPPAKIVVADDLPQSRQVLSAMLATDGHVVYQAEDGAAALDLIQQEAPDLVLTDVQMPALSGFALCREVKSDPATRLIPVVLVTGFSDRQAKLEGITAGADDFVSKPVDAAELRARVRALVRLKRYTDELDSAEAIILSLAMTVEARDHYTSGHCERMAAYAVALGRHLALSREEVAALRRGGILHDVGKIGVPDSILLKPGALTPDERELMRRHTTIGENLCGELRLLRLVRPIVRHHHERQDGSGYPDRLRGAEIPLLAQIMGVVDVFDALTTARPYRGAMTAEHAFAELHEEVQRGWHRADLVDEFAVLWQRGGMDAPLSAPPP